MPGAYKVISTEVLRTFLGSIGQRWHEGRIELRTVDGLASTPHVMLALGIFYVG